MVSKGPNKKHDKQMPAAVDVALRKVEDACKDYMLARETHEACRSSPEWPTTIARVEGREATSIALLVIVYTKQPRLTERERQVGRLVGHGLGNKGIGRELGVGGKTVQKHIERIKFKWGITTRAELARHAILQLG